MAQNFAQKIAKITKIIGLKGLSSSETTPNPEPSLLSLAPFVQIFFNLSVLDQKPCFEHFQCGLKYVSRSMKVTYMEKTQVYLREEELDAVRKAAARSGRSVAEVIRHAIREVVLSSSTAGPVAIWDGKPKRTSIEHDSIHDEP